MFKKFLNNIKSKINNNKTEDFIDYLEINIAEHCNLNCQCCLHFSPLAKEEIMDTETFEQQIKRLSEITETRVRTISIMGGEPLLNPHCAEIFYIARKYLPETKFQLVTNGILLTSQTKEFWQSLKENNIVLRPTKYPIEIDWGKIKKIVNEYNVNLDFYNDINIEKTSYRTFICKKGIKDYKRNFEHCKIKKCRTLANNKIYPCVIPSNLHHFNEYFNENIPVSEKNGIDIFKAKNIKQLKKFLSKPIPMCKYCKGSTLITVGKWELSKKNISEWS